ncbi:hypothetical protein COB52_02345 [Candidatus Kaiserbacteria bacterium]|nr:MAG: hypothetical protein COB52_02345 [Candidatus Kaiserbacteria bacterium]
MKAIIFDFDGVLIDSYSFSRGIVKKIGHEVSEEDFKAHHDGNVFKEPKIPFTDESAQVFYDEYISKVHTQSPLFSFEEIDKLSKEFDLYIISSNGEELIERFLSHYELDHFKRVLGARFHKSKVEKFKYLFKEYNLEPSDCVFITDTLGDILEGHEVGVKSIAVDFGFHDRERLEKGRPYRIVSNFNEMMDAIKSL